jgi:hypothetical protein
MTTRRQTPEEFTAPRGTVTITLTNDVSWARDVFYTMPENYIQRVAQDIEYETESTAALEDILEEIWDCLEEDAFDGGRTAQGLYFFIVTVARDGQNGDEFVCSSSPLAHAVKDEILATLM